MSASSQFVYEVFEHQKSELLLHLLDYLPDFEQVLVLANTRDGVHALTTALSHAEVRVESIHGNKKQELRYRALAEFNEGKLRALVSTDAMARDLNISCSHTVVYFDFPELAADYLQNAKQNRLIILALPNDPQLAKLEQSIGHNLTQETAPNFSYDSQPARTKSPRKKGGKSKGNHSKPLQNKKPKFKNKRGRK